MVELVRGDILQADTEALVNTVNCVGAMGRGIALQFRKAFPDNYAAYKAACGRKELRPGMMFVHELGRMVGPRAVINFPTKRHWRARSRLEDIEAGLRALVDEVRERGIRSIAIPPLGCGLGGLAWGDVRPMVEDAFHALPEVRVLLFEPKGAPAAESMAREAKAPRMTISRASLLGLMRRYLAGFMDPFVSLLEIHKLMYFMQESGEELSLRYAKAPYGPYAENLRHLLSRIEGHFITGYGDAEDAPDRHVELAPEAASMAESFLQDKPETTRRFGKVVDLIEGFETPHGMELLSTVHWVATREETSSAEQAVARTYAWAERKRMFSEEHIHTAWDVLDQKGWLAGLRSEDTA